MTYCIMKKILSFFWEVIKIVVIALVIVAPIRYFLFQPFLVKGQSMEPSFENGDYLIIDEISYRLRQPERGEVVVFKYPQNLSQRFIKRIIGLPGETIEIKDGVITIIKGQNTQALDETKYLPSSIQTWGNLEVTLKENEYFVMGDNREFSFDSRSWGPLLKEDLIGRVYVRVLPFVAFAKITAPSY